MLRMTRFALKFMTVPLLLLASNPIFSEDFDSYALGEGGRLYDNWAAELAKQAPDETHPGYNDYKGKKRGAATWRCKECHGWDYLGAAGDYGKGAHYTGTQGIAAYRGTSIAQVIDILHNDNHVFDRVLSDKQLETVAAFVVLGQVNMRAFIDVNTNKIAGDASKGRETYKRECMLCHGNAGKMRNLSHIKDKKRYMGDVANKNPWETMHKIRFGHPGMRYTDKYDANGKPRVNMPAMLGVVPLQAQIDLLAYLVTLSKK